MQSDDGPKSLRLLMQATNDGKLEAVKKLVAAGADVKHSDPNAISPLLMSIINNHLDVAGMEFLETWLVERKTTAGQAALVVSHDRHFLNSVCTHMADLDYGKITVLTKRYEGKRYNQPNDITIDSKGRIYFSDPQYGDRQGMEMRDDRGRTVEGVYRIDRRNRHSQLA